MRTIAMRQSCRAYSNEQLSEHELRAVLEAANAAPVGMGKYDEVKLTVIQDPALLARLDAAGAAFFGDPGRHPLYGAPTVVLVSAKVADGRPEVLAYCNAACIVENMHLAATDLGLGSVYLFGVIRALAADATLCAACKVPEGFVPASAVALGRAAEPPGARPLTVSRIATDRVS